MSKKVLVVDDEPGIVKMVSSRLTSNGYDVETATEGKDAIEKCKVFKPDAILLDVVMPGMDGPAVAAHLQSHPETAKIPIIFLTAIVTPQEVAKDHVIGGHFFIAKPFKAEDLLKLLERVLKQR